jgi:hypothetical protein
MFATTMCAVALGKPVTAKAETNSVEIFFQTCIATVPSFEGMDDSLGKYGFVKIEGVGSIQHHWGRHSDGDGAIVTEADDRRICMISRIGIHTDQFVNDLEKKLWTKFGFLWERKQYQGRHLYLVRVAKINVLIEVIPPISAITYIAAYVPKEK